MQIMVGLFLVGALSLTAQEGNLLENGDFGTKTVAPWKIFAVKKVPATAHALKEGVLIIDAKEAGDKEWKRQLAQDVAIESNTKYVLTFKLKAALEAPGNLRLLLTRTKDPSKPHYGLWKNINLKSAEEMKEHTVYFTTKEIDPEDPAGLRFQLGTLKGTLEFDEIELKKRS